MKSVFTVLLLCLIQISHQKCISEDECGYGTCQNSECVCEKFFKGNNCEEKWSDDDGWLAFWIIFIVYTTVIHTVLIALFSYQLKLQKLEKNIVTFALLLLIGGSAGTIILLIFLTWASVRVVNFAVDGQGFTGIFPQALEIFMYYLPAVFWFLCYYIVTFYWLRLSRSSRLTELNDMR